MNKETSQPLGPVKQSERIDELDVLRGFAIFGIFVINVRVFSGYSFASEEMKADFLLTRWDDIFDWIHIVFFNGKFYTLFSLLFGIGFAVILVRATKADRSFLPFFSRRLFILLIIGVIHLWGIWYSDILVIYALCGYILILFKELSSRSLLWLFLLLVLAQGFHTRYLHANDNSYTKQLYTTVSDKWTEKDLPKASEKTEGFRLPDLAQVVRDDSWKTVFKFNSIGPIIRFYFVSYDSRIIKVLAIFVLGLWVGRSILFHDLLNRKLFLVKIAIAGWIIGLPLNILFREGFLSGNDAPFAFFAKEVLESLAYVSLSSAYAASFILLYKTRFKKMLNSLFTSVGKTALTNYILQSFIGIALFYTAALGIGEYSGSTLLTIIVVMVFVFQIIGSNIWLNYFRYGPLEWIWRMLTYGKYIKIRLDKTD